MPRLEWLKHHPDAIGSHTKCKRYTTCIDSNGQWEVWKVAHGGPWFATLACKLPDEAAAKACAEEDAG